MANPLEILKGIKIKVTVEKGGGISELISRVFTTRNLVHFAHWSTKSFASHSALGELYENIIDETDNLVETYQGEFGLIVQKRLNCLKILLGLFKQTQIGLRLTEIR